MSGLALAVVAGCGPYTPQTVAERDCAKAVLGDWSDGSIDGVYPDNCYPAAIDALPEDLRAYTSAGDDITRAWNASRAPLGSHGSEPRRPASVSGHVASGTGSAPDEIPRALVTLGALVLVVGASGLVALGVRRRRGAP